MADSKVLAEVVVTEDDDRPARRRRTFRTNPSKFVLRMEPFREGHPGGGPFVGEAQTRTESTGQFVAIPSTFQFREEDMIHFDDKTTSTPAPSASPTARPPITGPPSASPPSASPPSASPASASPPSASPASVSQAITGRARITGPPSLAGPASPTRPTTMFPSMMNMRDMRDPTLRTFASSASRKRLADVLKDT